MNEQDTNNELVELIHFIADTFRCSEDGYHFNTRWLCTRRSIQDNAVKMAKERYEDWKARELAAKSAREDIRTNGPYSKV